MKHIKVKVAVLSALTILGIYASANAAFSIPWNGTTTTGTVLGSPNLVNGIFPIPYATNYIATSTSASLFPYASTTAISSSILTSGRCVQAGTGGLLTAAAAACGTGAATDKWATTTNLVGIYPNGGTNIAVIIGRSATTTNSLLEVNGTTTAVAFVATSTNSVSSFTLTNTTNATTSGFAVTSVLSKILKTDGSGTVVGAANGTDYTLITANTCGGTTKFSAVTAAGSFTCSTDQTASSTLLGDNNTWTGANVFANASTTRLTLLGPLYDITPSNGTAGQILMSSGGLLAPRWVSTTTSTLCPTCVTSVTASYPIVSSGGTTPNLTFIGLSTTSPWTNGQVAYVTANNAVTSVATGTITCTGSSISCNAGSYVIGSNLTITAAAGTGSLAVSTISGTIDGSNKTFTIPAAVTGKTFITLNGTIQTDTVDYTISGTTITYTTAPQGTGSNTHYLYSADGIGSSGTPNSIAYFDSLGNLKATSSILYSGSYVATTTTASVFPYASTTAISSSQLTSGQVPYATTGGLLTSNSGLLYDGNKFTATYATTTVVTSSGHAYFATSAGFVGIASSSAVGTPGLVVGAGNGAAGKSIVVAETKPATSTSITIDWSIGNTQLFRIGTAAVTFAFSNSVDGQSLKAIVCNPGTTAGAITWPTGILWPGGTAPTQTTTANKCDIWSFIQTQATSTVKILGAQTANF